MGIPKVDLTRTGKFQVGAIAALSWILLVGYALPSVRSGASLRFVTADPTVVIGPGYPVEAAGEEMHLYGTDRCLAPGPATAVYGSGRIAGTGCLVISPRDRKVMATAIGPEGEEAGWWRVTRISGPHDHGTSTLLLRQREG